MDLATSAFSLTAKTVEFVWELSGVREETELVHEQLETMESTIRQLQLLLNDRRIHITQLHREEINKQIHRAVRLINCISKPIRRSRMKEERGGKIRLWHRITWVLRDKSTVDYYQKLLPVRQNSLLTELNFLRLLLQNARTVDGELSPQPERQQRSEQWSPNIGRIRSPNPPTQPMIVESHPIDEILLEQNEMEWLHDEEIDQPKSNSKKRGREEEQHWLSQDLQENSEEEKQRSRRRRKHRSHRT